jgi:hypothetical protein
LCQVYRHIVLAVHDGSSGQWGALGLSRRKELMDKPLSHDSLASLVQDYHMNYSHWGHSLNKVRVGLPVEHDTEYAGPVCWRWVQSLGIISLEDIGGWREGLGREEEEGTCKRRSGRGGRGQNRFTRHAGRMLSPWDGNLVPNWMPCCSALC